MGGSNEKTAIYKHRRKPSPEFKNMSLQELCCREKGRKCSPARTWMKPHLVSYHVSYHTTLYTHTHTHTHTHIYINQKYTCDPSRNCQCRSHTYWRAALLTFQQQGWLPSLSPWLPQGSTHLPCRHRVKASMQIEAFAVVQLLSWVWLFVTLWTAVCQASLFFTIFPEFAPTHVHWVNDAIQPSHHPSPPSPSLNLPQHQGLFQWSSSSHQVAKVLELQLQYQAYIPYVNL